MITYTTVVVHDDGTVSSLEKTVDVFEMFSTHELRSSGTFKNGLEFAALKKINDWNRAGHLHCGSGMLWHYYLNSVD